MLLSNLEASKYMSKEEKIKEEKKPRKWFQGFSSNNVKYTTPLQRKNQIKSAKGEIFVSTS